jgi:hypothetical protein
LFIVAVSENGPVFSCPWLWNEVINDIDIMSLAAGDPNGLYEKCFNNGAIWISFAVSCL